MTSPRDERMAENRELSKEAKEYADKLFPCTKPCDSFGICEGCAERIVFESGYNFGAKVRPEPSGDFRERARKIVWRVHNGNSLKDDVEVIAAALERVREEVREEYEKSKEIESFDQRGANALCWLPGSLRKAIRAIGRKGGSDEGASV